MSGRGFIDRALRHLFDVEVHLLGTERDAARAGILQRVDARFKVICALLVLVAVAASHSILAIAVAFVLVTLLGALSSLSLRAIALRVWIPVGIFTCVIGLPALVTTAGTPVATIVGWTVTEQGFRAASLLVIRVTTATTIAYVLVASTTWPRLLAALRRLRVPAAIVVLLGLTQRYIFLLLGSAHDMLLSRRSREVGRLSGAAQRSLASAMAGSLMLRSLAMSHNVHHAMLARGFRGSFDSLETFEAKWSDAVALAFAVTLAALVAWSWR